MIGWSVINPVLLAVFTEIARDTTRDATDFKAEWKEGQRSLINPAQGFALVLKITSVTALGEDETRYSFDEDTQRQSEAQTGQRKFTLQVQAIVPNHTDEQWAFATIERVRTRIRRPRIIDRLLDIDVALISTGPAIKASFKDDGRVVSAGTMDIVFGCVAYEDDPIPGDWIAYLVMSSHLKEGTEVLEPALQMVNVEVPTIPVP